MSRIRSKNTKPELLVRKYLFSKGFRYKLHDKNLPGKPDIVLPKYKAAIYVQGCFWHGHAECKYYKVPKTRTEWWLNKINANINSDIKSIKNLRSMGWQVYEIWECELKKDKLENTLDNLALAIKSVI
jgi:DNA mismatch endonuclease (patch repair protein)